MSNVIYNPVIMKYIHPLDEVIFEFIAARASFE